MAPGEDVLKDGHVGVQGDVLERSCDASFRGQVGLEAHEELALPPDVALLGLVDLVDRIEQRSLTGAVGPDDGEQLIVVNVERDIVDSLDPLEEEMDVRDLEDGRSPWVRSVRYDAGVASRSRQPPLPAFVVLDLAERLLLATGMEAEVELLTSSSLSKVSGSPSMTILPVSMM